VTDPVPACLFCRVAADELPAQLVADTPRIIGVLNTLEPFSRGHCVFFPRRHATNLLEIDDADLREILFAVRDVAAKIGADNFNLLQNNGPLAGQTVFHAHLHLIPKWSEDEGLVYRREPKHNFGHGEMVERLVITVASEIKSGELRDRSSRHDRTTQ
jgi:histidine triad (HIT) family protein